MLLRLYSNLIQISDTLNCGHVKFILETPVISYDVFRNIFTANFIALCFFLFNYMLRITLGNTGIDFFHFLLIPQLVLLVAMPNDSKTNNLQL